jgi:hypothetical protein
MLNKNSRNKQENSLASLDGFIGCSRRGISWKGIRRAYYAQTSSIVFFPSLTCTLHTICSLLSALLSLQVSCLSIIDAYSTYIYHLQSCTALTILTLTESTNAWNGFCRQVNGEMPPNIGFVHKPISKAAADRIAWQLGSADLREDFREGYGNWLFTAHADSSGYALAIQPDFRDKALTPAKFIFIFTNRYGRVVRKFYLSNYDTCTFDPHQPMEMSSGLTLSIYQYK